jgi:large repetitive protein
MSNSFLSNRCARALFFGIAIASSNVFALQIFNVNSKADLVDDDVSDGVCHTVANTCTLRAAVMQANRSPNDGATINLPADTYTLARPPAGLDGEDSGDLDLIAPSGGNPPITIVGAGSSTTIIDANGIDRVFYVDEYRTVTFRNVTIRNGIALEGAGIENLGTVTLDHVVLTGNSTTEIGGGALRLTAT